MNDKEFKIQGLSSEHVEMLEIMWELDTQQEFDEWMLGLSLEQVNMALELKTLLLLEVMDQAADADISYAKNYLKKFQL